jgi:putative sigma-54 modulation protein
MQISVTFKNLDPSDALKAYAKKKLDRFDKLLDAPAEVSVVLSVEKIRHIAEVNLTGGKISIHATEETNNMYSSIDMVVDKLKAQINKVKKKSRSQRAATGLKETELIESEEEFEDEFEADDFQDSAAAGEM